MKLSMLAKIKNTAPEKIRVFKNTFALMIIQICTYIMPFITLPYLSRILEVDKLGLVFFAQAMMDYFNRVIMFGFELSGVRQIAINSDNKEKVNTIFNSILCVQIFLLLLCFGIIGIIVFTLPKFRTDWIVYFFTAIGLIGNILTFNWFYQGMERMKFITIINVITKLTYLVLIFVFVKYAGDYYLVPLLFSLSGILAGLSSLIFLKKEFKLKFYIPKLNFIIEEFKYSSEFFITKIAIALYRSTNAFILGIVVTSTAVAYYVAADKIFWGILSLYFTFINALFPYMSKNKDIIFFKKTLKYLIPLAICASGFILYAAKHLILIFYSDKYLESVRILEIFSFSFAFYVFVDTLGFPLLGAFGYVKETNSGYIWGGVYNCIGLLILYLINQINIYSVAVLVSSTYLVMFLHRMYYIRKYKLL